MSENETLSETTTPEKHAFQAEVQQVLDLVVHSLYSKKEIFLRELISNASDALDKLRFESLKHPEWTAGAQDYRIRIEFDEKANILKVCDNGIGMTREEVIEHLGTIAKSGTKAFLSQLSQQANGEVQTTDLNLIGQFGVGFYSVFMVADRVEVLTRHASLTQPDQAVLWSSSGQGEFTVTAAQKAERGTDVILHLKSAEKEFADPYRLRHIIHAYSEHLSFPIQMKEKMPEGETEQWETVNRATALWTLPKKDIQDQDYIEFYKQIAHDFQDPLVWNHARTEGKLEYISLLYIPKNAGPQLFYRDHKNGLKLYIQRVFIMDEVEYFLPAYLRFVRGVVDSQDLPLNVSREILQHNDMVDNIKAVLTKKVLGMIEKMAENPEEYQKFWLPFGKIFKEGVAEDRANADRIAKLLRFPSTHSEKETELVSLDDYVGRMKLNQKHIYYLIVDQWQTAMDNPHLEWFRQKGIEVLILHDRIDEWVVNHLNEYQGKTWQGINRADFDWKSIDDAWVEPTLTDPEQAFLKQLQEILKDEVREVRAANHLLDSPSCISTEGQDWSLQMQKWMRSVGDQPLPEQKPVLEVYLGHPLVSPLKSITDLEELKPWAQFLLGSAFLAETGQLAKPMAFLKPVFGWLKAGLAARSGDEI